jgi:hypothetical protein
VRNSRPHPKLVATTLAGAIATLVAAITQGTGTPAAIGAAVLTLTQALVGYAVPLRHVSPLPIRVRGPRNAAPVPSHPIVMFDSIEVSTVPAHPPAVAGYVGGWWPTFRALVRRFPRAHHLSIAVHANEDAEALDIERGDATIAQAAGWVRRQQRRGVRRPVLYISISQAAELLRVLAAAGIRRHEVRLWTAHYSYRPHLCSPACGFGDVHADATQYSDRALGRNLDESLVGVGFFGAPR